MEPNVIPAMERAAELWPQMDWWGAGDECLGLSFGGGVNTTALSLLLLWLGRKIEHIFSDLGPGAEHPRTVAFIDSYGQQVRGQDCKFTVIGPDSVYRIPSERMPLLDYIKLHQTIPRVPGPRWCTVSWKIRPIQRYTSLKFYGEMLGFSAEERARADRRTGLFYPLVEAEIDRQDCHDIIEAFGICNPGKSGCMFCPRVTHWYVYELWREGLIEHRLAVEEIPWRGKAEDPKHGQVVPLAFQHGNGKLTREMITDWERGENIPNPNQKEDLPCMCKW